MGGLQVSFRFSRIARVLGSWLMNGVYYADTNIFSCAILIETAVMFHWYKRYDLYLCVGLNVSARLSKERVLWSCNS